MLRYAGVDDGFCAGGGGGVAVDDGYGVGGAFGADSRGGELGGGGLMSQPKRVAPWQAKRVAIVVPLPQPVGLG